MISKLLRLKKSMREDVIFNIEDFKKEFLPIINGIIVLENEK